MFESVFSLRFLLLIVGALFVAGIYLWGGRKNKRKPKINYDPARARFVAPKRRSSSQGATSLKRSPDPDPGPDRDYADEIVIADEVPVTELPVITREGDDQTPVKPVAVKDSQLELSFDAQAVPDSARDPEMPGSEDAIIALYVRPPQGHEFAGPAIIRSMNSVGLRFGDMDIFHHYGAGELRTELPLFSVANMVEPGDFDLQDIESFATPGLALFLRLPGPLEGAVAFELFLNTAQRLAEALSGELYGEPKKLLDGAMIDRMRHSAIRFTNAG